jgi:hypothetical protein
MGTRAPREVPTGLTGGQEVKEGQKPPCPPLPHGLLKAMRSAGSCSSLPNQINKTQVCKRANQREALKNHKGRRLKVVLVGDAMTLVIE